MMRAADFQPDWVSPPGRTILRLLRNSDLSVDDVVGELNIEQSDFDQLIRGSRPLDHVTALRLKELFGTTLEFWLNRERNYRSALSRRAILDEVKSDQDFFRKFPISDLKRFGWLSSAKDRSGTRHALLDFFGVSNLSEWYARYKGELTAVAFRTSPSFESNPYATAAWLRRAEWEASDSPGVPFDRERLEASLHLMRQLVIVKDPARFLPQLKAICAACGVFLSVAPSPKGCRASGATRFLEDDRALVVLSMRHKTDDHFWFTFFHEIGHLILHSRDALFIEDGSDVTHDEEIEANAFSSNVLIPVERSVDLQSVKPDLKSVIRLARSIGVTPGIIVGHLQHTHRVRREQLNFLKRRYRWNADYTPEL